MLTPRAGSDGGGEGDVETLRARQDTVGAVVLVGGADDVHRQVAAGVSRCVGVLPKFFDFIRSSFISMPSSSHPYPPALNFFSLTAVVCYSSTLDALARSVGRFRHRCNETRKFTRCSNLFIFVFRLRYLVPAAGQNNHRLLVAAGAGSHVASLDKGSSSYNPCSRKRWPRGSPQRSRAPRTPTTATATATRTTSSDPYWSTSSTVRRPFFFSSARMAGGIYYRMQCHGAHGAHGAGAVRFP